MGSCLLAWVVALSVWNRLLLLRTEAQNGGREAAVTIEGRNEVQLMRKLGGERKEEGAEMAKLCK